MNKQKQKPASVRALIFSCVSLCAVTLSAGAVAQTSVTLYGVVDNAFTYASNQRGHSNITMSQGNLQASKFGFLGSEDLGGGTSTLFRLESGFNSLNGTQGSSGRIFNRQAYVGLSNTTYGTLTLGRQYTPYFAMVGSLGPTSVLTGATGAHPGDLDALDTDFRVNNSLMYTSPSFGGLKLSGMYALGGVPGSTNAGATWSVGAQYLFGAAGVGVGFARFNNATEGGGAWSSSSTAYSGTGEQGESSITNGYQNAAAQQRFAVTGGYQFSPQWDVSASYSNVQYIAGPNSGFSTTAIFNTGGAVLHYRPVTSWDLAAGYSYTRATQANGVEDAASYQQINLTELYNVSKRTRIYVLEAFQRANGQTINGGKVVTATAAIGEQSAASSRSQFAATIGINHTF